MDEDLALVMGAVSLVVWLGSVIAGTAWASSKGRAGLGFVATFFFGPLGLIIVAAAAPQLGAPALGVSATAGAVAPRMVVKKASYFENYRSAADTDYVYYCALCGKKAGSAPCTMWVWVGLSPNCTQDKPPERLYDRRFWIGSHCRKCGIKFWEDDDGPPTFPETWADGFRRMLSGK